MADFDAGSIEGTLDLDTTPFRAGLDKARDDAEKFEHEKHEANLGIDKAEFDAEKDEADADLDELGAKKAEPKVELKGAPETIAALGLVKHEMNKTRDSSITFGAALGILPIKLGLVTFGVLALSAALTPATAVLLAFAAAGAVALGGLVLGFLPFIVTIVSAIKKITEANKAGKELTGWAGKAQAGLKGLTDAWDKLQKIVAPQAFHFLAVAFEGVARVLPKLAPLIETVAKGMTHVVEQIFKVTKTPLFAKFLDQLQSFMKAFLSGFGPMLASWFRTFMDLFIALQPLMATLGTSIVNASKAAERFSSGGGIKKFLDYVARFAPLVGKLFGDLFRTLGQIGGELAPLAEPALKFLDALVAAFGRINIGPVVKGLSGLLNFLTSIISMKAAPTIIVAMALGVYMLVHALAVLGGPLTLIVVAIAAVAAGLVYAYKHSAVFRSGVQSLADTFQNSVVPALKQIYNWFMGKIVPMIEKSVRPVFRQLADTFTHQIVPAIESLWKSVKKSIPYWEQIITVIAKVAAWFLTHVLPAMIKVEGYIDGALIRAIGKLIYWFSVAVVKAGEWTANTVKFVARMIGDISSFFANLPGHIISFSGRMLSAGKSLMGHVFDGIKNVGADIIAWCEALPGRIMAAIGNIGARVGTSVANSIKSHLPKIPGLHIPGLLATGGVTTGMRTAIIGDNPGGHEAVIPLDKYDLPKKGEAGKTSARAESQNNAMLMLLAQIARSVAGSADHAALAEALGKVLGDHTDAATRRMIQQMRAGA